MRDQLDFFGVSDREVFDSIAAAMGGTLVGYSHRGEDRTPMEISVRLPQSDRTWGRPPRLDCRSACREPERRRAWSSSARWPSERRRPARHIYPPRRPRRRDGHRRARRRLRGADLRHARRRQGDPQMHDWGAIPTARHPPARPADRRNPADRALGRRMGDHLGDLPRHGRGVRRRDPGHLLPGRRPVQKLPRAAGHPDPHPADAGRHRDRPHPLPRASSPPPR